jgi:hypothetical protein
VKSLLNVRLVEIVWTRLVVHAELTDVNLLEILSLITYTMVKICAVHVVAMEVIIVGAKMIIQKYRATGVDLVHGLDVTRVCLTVYSARRTKNSKNTTTIFE